MNKEQLRERLKGLEAYIRELKFNSMFVEESSFIPMDSLLVSLEIDEDLSNDVTCNFIDIPDMGSMLQFYGEFELDEMLEEIDIPISDEQILYLINELNQMIPVGQILYVRRENEGNVQKLLTVRYTMLTDLGSEGEFKKCLNVFSNLTQIYDVLLSVLLMLMDGNSVDQALSTLQDIMNGKE